MTADIRQQQIIDKDNDDESVFGVAQGCRRVLFPLDADTLLWKWRRQEFGKPV